MRSSSIDYKQRAIEQWTADPCGPLATDLAGLLRGRRAYAPFMAKALDYEGARGLSVLNVGCGQEIDLCEYALAGARVTGIDLTPRHVELASRHLDELGLEGTVVEGDAEELSFPDETFDRVSSNGVLHHTPDMPRALAEIYRVLRPGGCATVIVYNRASGFYWVEQVLRFGLLQRQLLRERTMANVLSRNVERSSIGARPLVRVHSGGTLRRLLATAGFRDVTVTPSPFRAVDTFLTRRLPRPVQAALSSLPAEELCWGIWSIPESELRLLDKLAPSSDVIELGCGTATISAWLARGGMRPVAVDISRAQLDLAARLQLEFGPAFPLIHANAEQVPFDIESFDFSRIRVWFECLV